MGSGVQKYVCYAGEVRRQESHLLFSCIFTKIVWRTLLSRAGYNWLQKRNWEEEVHWVVQMAKGRWFKQRGLWPLFNAFVSGVWQQRKRCIFRGNTAAVQNVIAGIWYEVKTKLLSSNLKMERGAEKTAMETIWGMKIKYTVMSIERCSWRNDVSEFHKEPKSPIPICPHCRFRQPKFLAVLYFYFFL